MTTITYGEPDTDVDALHRDGVVELSDRRTYLGPSDAAAALGMSPWESALELYQRKKGMLPPKQETLAMRWGRLLEDDIAEEFARVTGMKVRRLSKTFRYDRFPWLCGHIDRKVEGYNRLLECKTTGYDYAKQWGEHGSDKIPLYYRVQVMLYLWLTGYEAADVAVLIGGQDFRVLEVRRDEQIIDDLVGRCQSFWDRHIVPAVAPEPRNLADADLTWPLHSSGSVLFVEPDDAIVKKLDAWNTLKEELAFKEQALDAIEFDVKTTMGLNSELRTRGGGPKRAGKETDKLLAKWKLETRGILDQGSLRATRPHVFMQHRRMSESRVLRISRPRGKKATT